MTGRLREELGDVADRAPVVEVPDDTWARGQQARRRDRAAVLAATVAAVALVAGVLAWWTPADRPPVAGATPDGALPDHVWAVPERMSDRDERGRPVRDEVESDLAVGRGAVAFVSRQGMPVVVDASDGDYHLLDLPGFTGGSAMLWDETGSIELSPDGRWLAYSWYAPQRQHRGDPMPSGVRVAELEDGSVRTVRLRGGAGVDVTGFEWSPGSRWLAWGGVRTAEWTGSSIVNGRQVAGRIAPGGTTSADVPIRGHNGRLTVAISDQGEVALSGDGTVTRIPVEGRTQVVDLHVGVTFSWDSEYVGSRLLDLRVCDKAPRNRLFELLPSQQRIALPDRLGEGDLELLGWVDAEHVLVREPEDGGGSRLVLLGVGDHASYDVVGAVDPKVPPISTATDLVTLERPTVARPEPGWPWSEERWVVTVGLGALVVVVAAGVGLVVRRRRHG